MAYNVKFLKGALENYNALAAARLLDENTFYYVQDANASDLYLGNLKLSNDADVQAATSRISKNESDITSIFAELELLSGGDSGSISQQISSLRTELTKAIENNSAAIKAEEDRAKAAEEALQTSLGEVSAKTNAAFDKAGANETAIGGIQTAIADLADIRSAVGTHTGQLSTLIGDDASKSVRTIANEELAKQLIPEGAQDALNTLEEIAAWIQEHPEDAASMNADIAKNKGDITALQTTTGEHTSALALIESQLSTLSTQVGTNETAIGKNKEDILALQEADRTNLETAKGYVDALKDTLGSAAYKATEDFDATGSAAAALNDAKAYTDTALTWGAIANQ